MQSSSSEKTTIEAANSLLQLSEFGDTATSTDVAPNTEEIHHCDVTTNSTGNRSSIHTGSGHGNPD